MRSTSTSSYFIYNVEIFYYHINKLEIIDIVMIKMFFNINVSFLLTDLQFQKITNGFKITKLENVCLHAFKNLLDKRYSLLHFIKRNSYPNDPKKLHIFIL